jgi:hypothetical protein
MLALPPSISDVEDRRGSAVVTVFLANDPVRARTGNSSSGNVAGSATGSAAGTAIVYHIADIETVAVWEHSETLSVKEAFQIASFWSGASHYRAIEDTVPATLSLFVKLPVLRTTCLVFADLTFRLRRVILR